MFVQNESLIDKSLPPDEAPTLINPKGLSDVVEDLNKVNAYKTMIKGDTTEIRAEQLIHSLVRINRDGESIPPESQEIGSFAGFQALLESEVSKSKPFYWLTFPKPPFPKP